jgi:hypothetical protein
MSLESIPTYLSDALDISLEAAQVILSIVVIFSLLLPVVIVTRGKSTMVYTITIFLTEAFLVGVGWLPFWILIATVAMMALAVATLGVDAVVGRS